MIIVRIIAVVFGILGVVGTLLPFLRYDDWWIRGFDYPRQQMIILLGLSAVLWLVSSAPDTRWHWPVFTLLILASCYQAYRILPYTPLWKKDALDAMMLDDEDRHLSLLMSNVLQTNNDYGKVIELVKDKQPDIFLAVETNETWKNELDRGIKDDYPHVVYVPLENLYGMILYSRLPLDHHEIKYRIKDDIPSIDARVTLPIGRTVNLFFVHPMPPSPSEAYASTGRDAELAMVGRLVRERGGSSIVAGDLNDVAWSHSTRLFQRLSGLVDARRGRGLYSTFHADYRLARWPLDHVFHSTDFTIVGLEKLSHVGSDHFPIYIKLSYEPAQDEQQGEEPDAEDQEEAEETIEMGKRKEDNVILEQE